MLNPTIDLKVLDVVRDVDLADMAKTHPRAALSCSRSIRALQVAPYDGVEVRGGVLEAADVRVKHVDVDPLRGHDGVLRIVYRVVRLEGGALRVIVLAAGWATRDASAMEGRGRVTQTATDLAEARVRPVLDVFRAPAPRGLPVEALV